jgi:hypothetical protein
MCHLFREIFPDLSNEPTHISLHQVILSQVTSLLSRVALAIL